MGLQLPIKASRPSCEALLLSPSTGATILNCRHSQQRRSSIVLHTDRRFASRETACPGYPHTLPPLRGAGALRRNVRVPACGKGETPSPVPSPHGDSHHGPLHGEIRKMSRTRLPTGYRHDCPRPREGAGEEAEGRAEWGCRRRTYEFTPAGRGKPPPRPPPPMAIFPRSTPRGDPGGEPDRALSPRTAPSRVGAGGRGGGCRKSVWVCHLGAARAGWGDRGERSVADGAKARYGLFIWNRCTSSRVAAEVREGASMV